MASQRNVPVSQWVMKATESVSSGPVIWQNSGSAALRFIFLVRPDECEILNRLSEYVLFYFHFRGNQAFWPFVFGPNWNGQFGLVEICPLEICHFEICLFETYPFEICPFEPRRLEPRPLEPRPLERSPLEPRPFERRHFEICILELRPFERRPLELRPLEPRPLELRHYEPRVSEVRPIKHCPLEPCHLEICIRQVNVFRMTWKLSEPYLSKVWLPASVLLPPLVFGCSEVGKGAQGCDHVTWALGGIVCLGLMVWHEREGRLGIFLLLFFRLPACVAHKTAEQILYLKIMALWVGYGQFPQRENPSFAYWQAIVGQHRSGFGKAVGILSLLHHVNLLLRYGRTPDGQWQTDHAEQNKTQIAKMGDVIGVFKMAFNVQASRGKIRPNLGSIDPHDEGKEQENRHHYLPSAKPSGNSRYFLYGRSDPIEPYGEKIRPTIRQFSFLLGQILQGLCFAEPCSFHPSFDVASHVNPFRGKTLLCLSFISGCEGAQ